MPQQPRNCRSPAATRDQRPSAAATGHPGGSGRAVLVEVYLLRCRPDGLLAYRREAGHLAPGETPDTAAWRAGTCTGSHQDSPLVLHSTSWRHLDDGTIVLTYAALPDPEPGRRALPIRDLGMARTGDPRRPSPPDIRHEQVAAHAARHLALLVGTDPLVRQALDQYPQLGRALALLAQAPAGQLTGGPRRPEPAPQP